MTDRTRRLVFGPALRAWSRSGFAGLAAEIAFYFLLSIFPALLLVSAILTFFPDCRSFYVDVQTLASALLPESASELVEQSMAQADICASQAEGAFSFGLVLLLIAGSNVFAVIARSMNRAYAVTETRPFWKRRILAVTFFVGAVLTSALAFPVFVLGGRVGVAVAQVVGFTPEFLDAWRAALIPIAAISSVGALSILYRFGPAWKVRWRAALQGAAASTIGVIVVSVGFRAFVAYLGRYQALYGALASLIVLIIWLYLIALVLLGGGYLVARVQRSYSSTEPIMDS